MNPLSLVATGIKKDRDASVRYEIERAREPGRGGVEQPPGREGFLALDRARIAALGYALDGPTFGGDRYTGEISIVMVLSLNGQDTRRELVDVIDERVAHRLLNEVRLPRPGDLFVSIAKLQGDVDMLRPFRD